MPGPQLFERHDAPLEFHRVWDDPRRGQTTPDRLRSSPLELNPVTANQIPTRNPFAQIRGTRENCGANMMLIDDGLMSIDGSYFFKQFHL